MDLASLKLALAAAELTVLEKLGEGGEGEVFLAEVKPTEAEAERGAKPRRMALKLLKGDRVPPTAALELRHPRIVSVLRRGEALGRPWLLMDYFPGKSLRARLGGRPLPLAELRVVFDGVASALEHAHAAGVVHQDVKPDNVLVHETPAGLDVRLTDFGLAAELDEREREALLASRSVRSNEAQELRSLAGTLGPRARTSPARSQRARPEDRRLLPRRAPLRGAHRTAAFGSRAAERAPPRAGSALGSGPQAGSRDRPRAPLRPDRRLSRRGRRDLRRPGTLELREPPRRREAVGATGAAADSRA